MAEANYRIAAPDPETDYQAYLSYNGLEDTERARGQFDQYSNDMAALGVQGDFVHRQLDSLHNAAQARADEAQSAQLAKIAAMQRRLWR